MYSSNELQFWKNCVIFSLGDFASEPSYHRHKVSIVYIVNIHIKKLKVRFRQKVNNVIKVRVKG